MDRSYSRKASMSLPPPGLPQAEQGGLDLSRLADDTVRVYVPGYPERNVGDRLTVNWRRGGNEVVRRYAYLADPTRDQPDTQYEVRIQPLWVLLPGDYEVDYTVTSRTGNNSQSKPASITVVGTPEAPTVLMGGVIQTRLFGVYRPGLVGAWIAPGPYAITSERDVLIHSLGASASTSKTTLQLYKNKNGDDQPFASIFSGDSGEAWTVSVLQTTRFVRGDLISIELEGATDAAIFLALAV